jgi:prolyl-tRNA editing enzyme YbaK/EbsC (Cys-tRNA(Pro) deacylase)
MNSFEERLKTFIRDHDVKAEHLSFDRSCHSVSEAAEAAGARPEDFIKSICMIGPEGSVIVAIVKGEDRASASEVGKFLRISRPRFATPDEMLQRTGYPCGGTPPFGFEAVFLIDDRVMEMDVVYAGGGSESSLIRVSPEEILKANGGLVATVRKL